MKFSEEKFFYIGFKEVLTSRKLLKNPWTREGGWQKSEFCLDDILVGLQALGLKEIFQTNFLLANGFPMFPSPSNNHNNNINLEENKNTYFYIILKVFVVFLFLNIYFYYMDDFFLLQIFYNFCIFIFFQCCFLSKSYWSFKSCFCTENLHSIWLLKLLLLKVESRK